MTTTHAVVIAGAGPTGLVLAAELALAGIDVAIVERRATQELAGTRAGGLHARTIEVFDQRGIADRFLAEGTRAQVAGFAWHRLDIGDFPTRHPYGLALSQNHVERILAGWVAELGVPIYRERDVTGCAQDDLGVDLAITGGEPIRAGYLVGCDGGRSTIRKAAGIAFPGSDATTSCLLAEATLADEPPWAMRHDATGIHGFSKLAGGDVRIMLTEPSLAAAGSPIAPTLADLRAALVAIWGRDFGVHDATWISRFTDAARQAATYRDRRVLLAGDAAHVHGPDGGQGLNLGVQDATNLGWKLARVVRGTSPDALLDTYERERQPIAARVLRNTRAQAALRAVTAGTTALREVIGDLLAMDEPRRRFAAMMSGLDVHYASIGGGGGDGHPLVGRRMPDRDLVIAGEPRRTFELLHAAEPVLLDLGANLAPPDVRTVRTVRATCALAGPWELPVLGAVPAPAAVLVRPDGYVAWAGEPAHDAAFADALATWCGAR